MTKGGSRVLKGWERQLLSWHVFFEEKRRIAHSGHGENIHRGVSVPSFGDGAIRF